MESSNMVTLEVSEHDILIIIQALKEMEECEVCDRLREQLWQDIERRR